MYATKVGLAVQGSERASQALERGASLSPSKKMYYFSNMRIEAPALFCFFFGAKKEETTI
jgi:hypothetical protein